MKNILCIISLLCMPLVAKEQKFYTPEQDKGGMTNSAAIDQSLPNVLILGDSISIGYTQQVRDGLKGKANVIRARDNCGDTRMGLLGLKKWLGSNHWDAIHFNWGLWDLCYRDIRPKEGIRRNDKVNGKLSTSLKDYEKNLEAIVLQLKKTGAVLIWASTTVVPEGEPGRFVGDDVKYNAVAERVMKKHGVLIDDLYSTAKAFPPEMSTKPGDVHYTKKGYAKLAEQVVAKISEALKLQGQ
ncbi:MAG: SGNH/GDSL hydrolase family protein [bacterium]